MHFDWATFAFQLVNILVLMWLLGRYFFRPVTKIIAERQSEVDRLLKAAEASQAEAETARGAVQAAREAIAAERLKVIETAVGEAEARRAAMLAKAADEAAAAVANAQQAVTERLEGEQREQMGRAVDLAILITHKLLDELPAEARVTGYPERLSQVLNALSQERRAELAGSDGTLRIVAPRPLTKPETALAMAAVGAVAQNGALPVEVDAGLLAGLELRSSQGVIHNSLRYDLGRIAEALVSHEKR